MIITAPPATMTRADIAAWEHWYIAALWADADPDNPIKRAAERAAFAEYRQSRRQTRGTV